MCTARILKAYCMCEVGYENLAPCERYHNWLAIQPVGTIYENYPELGCETWAPVKYSDKICFKCKCESMRLRKPWSEIKADEAIEMALPVLEERDARRS